jgi:hypothetical protein
MNTIKTNLKKELLLGAGLNVLHFESKEWLDTIQYWKDEITFFNNILKKNEISKENKPEYEKMLKNLDKIHTDLYDDIEDSIIEHEKLLTRIEHSEKGISDYDYREKHRHISSRIDTFTKDFKTFKKTIFEYTKKI